MFESTEASEEEIAELVATGHAVVLPPEFAPNIIRAFGKEPGFWHIVRLPALHVTLYDTVMENTRAIAKDEIFEVKCVRSKIMLTHPEVPGDEPIANVGEEWIQADIVVTMEDMMLLDSVQRQYGQLN